LRLFTPILLIFILISPLKANTIYYLIKIPNLKVYQTKTPNKLKYFYAENPFTLGTEKNIKCSNSNKEILDIKYKIISKNLAKYSEFFLKKINLKYIVLCKNLSISGINTAGIPDHEMKTLIIDIKFDENYFERVIHHEVFHLINESYKILFKDNEWKNINDSKFNYAKCSTCSVRLNLSLLDETDGFLTEYSMSTASEDMAEVFSFLVTDREKIENKSLKDPVLSKKISYIKKNIFKIDKNFKF